MDTGLKSTKKSLNYQWQGETVLVEFGVCKVKTNKEKPLYWYNYECLETGEAEIPALRVTTLNGETFILGNHFGVAERKLLKGGWPNHGHFSLDGEFTHTKFEPSVFDKQGFDEHEEGRRTWQYGIASDKDKALMELIEKKKGFRLENPSSD